MGGEIPLDMRLGGGQLVSEELMNLGESFIQTNDPSLKLFQCAVCNKFKYWSFNFSISPSNEFSGLISFRIDWFDFLAVREV